MFPIPMSDVADMACLLVLLTTQPGKGGNSCDRQAQQIIKVRTPLHFAVYFVVHDSNCCLKSLTAPQIIFLQDTNWYPSKLDHQYLLQI
jgi:hypothetical protein